MIPQEGKAPRTTPTAANRIKVGQLAHLHEGSRAFIDVPGESPVPVIVREVICASLRTGQPPRAKVETECGLQAVVPQHELLIDTAQRAAAPSKAG